MTAPLPLLKLILVRGVQSAISLLESSKIFWSNEEGICGSWNEDTSGVEGFEVTFDCAIDVGERGRSFIDALVRSMPNKLAPARPKLSSGCASDPSSSCIEAVNDAAEGERGRDEDPENKPRIADTVVDGLRCGPLDRRDDTEPERPRPCSCVGELAGDGEDSMAWARIDSMTSKSPRGSTTPF